MNVIRGIHLLLYKNCYRNEEPVSENGGPSDGNKPENKEIKTPLRSPALDAVQKLISLTPTSGSPSTPSTPKAATVSNVLYIHYTILFDSGVSVFFKTAFKTQFFKIQFSKCMIQNCVFLGGI